MLAWYFIVCKKRRKNLASLVSCACLFEEWVRICNKSHYIIGWPVWANARDFATYRICANASNKRPCWRIQQTRGLNFGLPQKSSLHRHPYFVYASSEGSGESVHMRRLGWAFAARWCGKYRNLVYWSISEPELEFELPLTKMFKLSRLVLFSSYCDAAYMDLI